VPVKQTFEFRVFPSDEFGEQKSADEFTLLEESRDAGTARSKAGRLAKKHNGPVDLAYGYEPGGVAQDWNDRYITTASPSEYHSTGYRFERLG
jgi:hypothetical protein